MNIVYHLSLWKNVQCLRERIISVVHVFTSKANVLRVAEFVRFPCVSCVIFLYNNNIVYKSKLNVLQK